MSRVADWLSERIPIRGDQLRELTNEPVPNHMKRWWFCLGGTPAYLFVVQIVTGILLAIYYQPSPQTAYESVRYITDEVHFRLVLPQHAQVGRDADDRRRDPASDAGLLHRRLPPAARVELDDRHVPAAVLRCSWASPATAWCSSSSATGVRRSAATSATPCRWSGSSPSSCCWRATRTTSTRCRGSSSCMPRFCRRRCAAGRVHIAVDSAARRDRIEVRGRAAGQAAALQFLSRPLATPS